MNPKIAESRTVEVTISEPCFEEKKYALEVMLSTILGYECVWKSDYGKNQCIVRFSNGYEIFFMDDFFRKCASGFNPKKEMLPVIPLRITHPDSPEEDVVFLYGAHSVIEGINHTILGPDIIASSFFFLSRWEETVITERDQWGRIPDASLFSRKHGIDYRPLVDEYASWIANLASSHGVSARPRRPGYRLLISHDMDRLYLQSTRSMLKQAIEHRMPKRFIVWLLYRILMVNQKSTVKRMMDMSEKAGLVSSFYWMAGGSFPFDCYYGLDETEIREMMAEVAERGHTIGFHPGFTSSTDPATWQAEKAALEACTGRKVTEGRQHYLKMDFPGTLRIWEENSMKVDSSLGFSRRNGFRCGTGNEYPLFDVIERRCMELTERPLIVMDAGIRKGSLRKADKKRALELIDSCKRYEMPCTILFHNHLLDPVPWNDMPGFFRKIIAGTPKGRL